MEFLRQRWQVGQASDGVMIPAIVNNDAQWSCQRCGNEDQTQFYQYYCETCQKACWYCRECVSFGRMTTCTFIGIDEQPFQVDSPTFAWEGTLSEQQQFASDEVRSWLEQGVKGMVYAVCGAGKTEMMFAGIYQALQAGKRVCWATPRSDVVKELFPRLQQVFPQTPIAAHYQGSELASIDAPLVVATTHQLVRYAQAFDWIIIDEVDAFPYTVDTKLTRFVQRALTARGQLVYLTATPSLQLQKEFQQANHAQVILPARYHRRPLPVPKIQLWGPSTFILKMPWLRARLFALLDRLIAQGRVWMVFVPTITIGLKIAPVFTKKYGEQFAFVYSSDEQRQAKVAALRQRECKVLMTTTILERGVTIDWCEVLVLDADHDVFEWSALVQISGRVDRKTADAEATVRFLGAAKTKAMKQAIKEIKQCNRIALERGLIE